MNTEANRLSAVMERNARMISLIGDYLNERPRLLSAEMVDNLARECFVTRKEAFLTLFSAACGLDTADNREHRELERDYVLPGLRLLDPLPYRNDEYVRTVRVPEISGSRWSFGTGSYAPFEPFACGDPVLTEEFREIPQIGYFEEEFTFPAVYEDGVEWMTVKPNEVETMKAPLAACRGDVLTLGLGMGYFAFHASQKEEVRSVTVVERDPEVIELFCTHLLPQFPHREKIRVERSDAFGFMETEFPRRRFDTVFADLWHDASDGLELYLRLKKYETARGEKTRFDYWIEASILSLLRRIVYRKWSDPASAGKLSGTDPRKVLTDDALRRLAGELRI